MIQIKKITEKLMKEGGYSNINAVPKIDKVAINIGIGQAKTNPKFLESATLTLATITGQKPALRVAKKAVAGFKIRQKEKVGLMVTLRGKRMSDFIEKLANIVLPRMRDFRGLKKKSFDKQGNLSLGLSEQVIFPEITHEKATTLHGLSITIKTTAKNAKEAQKLLEAWGLPFERSLNHG